ncbi:ABC transporter permease [Actinoplanes teichomyceticus]|uniref:ABC-2 type transport system permease protein n=1 Tax=Actinoplanes teichomyceticus TaxID=1867 RepID=A0A561WKF3_ACTTI|nr:polyketide antibiotic transporter [Actinoplanes teichomyceticus]TWG24320.1 ABC-2 type transport system permease protein [Actinoplanes teichomyceticus]GIF12829.1 ABC transporter permease [Actinoplanes teichomyceticus]
MSLGTLSAPADLRVTSAPAPGRAVTWLAVRQIRRGALIVVGLAAGMTALVAATYAQVMADPAAAGSLQALAGNPAIRTLFGAPIGLDTAGGFTVWRVGTVIAVLLGTWSILATTRITRGEEDAGRWDLLLSSRLPAPAVLLRHLIPVMVVAAATATTIMAVLLLAGTEPAGALLHGTGTGLLGMFFAAVAALAVQLFPARSPATGTAVAVLGVSLLVRMIGDGVTALGWLLWLSPFGLLSHTGPYVHNRVPPLLLLAAATALLTVLALGVARRRDVRDGLIPAAAGRRPRTLLLASAATFAVRRVLRPLAGWMLGIGAYYLLIGLTTVSVTDFLRDNPAMAGEASQAGFEELGSTAGFAATLFAILAMPAGGFVTVRMTAFLAAESDRRLTLLASQPITRLRLIGAEITVIAAAAAVLITGAGLATWLGVTAIGGELAVTDALRGTWNVLPIVLLSLGAAVFAVGWAPRWTGLVGGLPTIGGFLLLVTAESIAAPDWVRDLSPFAHLAPVPLTEASLATSAVMLALATLLTLLGIAAYRRRDLLS